MFRSKIGSVILEELIIPLLQGVTWGSRGSGVSSTEVLTESRHGVPAKSQKLSNPGFARSLADKRWLSQWSTDIA